MIFPAWEKLKVRKSVQRALDGINSVSVGFACAALYIMSTQVIDQWVSIAIVVATFLLLLWDKIPSTYLILVGLLIGLLL